MDQNNSSNPGNMSQMSNIHDQELSEMAIENTQLDEYVNNSFYQ